jgi:hypothetical protein
MTNRRAFLAALGLSAGAFALGLPRVVSAARGRRGARPEPAPLPCACGGGSDDDRGCILACPMYLYTQANGVYYYYCQCCNILTQHVIVPTGLPSVVGVPCADDSCFTLPGGPGERRRTTVETCGFAYKAKRKDLTLTATPYQNGIPSLKKHDELEAEVRGTKVQVDSIDYINYDSRKVALYALSRLPPGTCPLFIGQETSTDNGNPHNAAYTVNKNPDANFPHYHQVTHTATGNIFHVAIKQ